MSVQILKSILSCSKLLTMSRSPKSHLVKSGFLPVRFCSTSADGKAPRPESMGGQRSNEVKKSPITWINFAITAVFGLILFGSYKYAVHTKEKERALNRKREIGKAKIGGTFDLIDQDGQPKKSIDFFGKWILLYFGFTHCPDICPDEMEKLSKTYDRLTAIRKTNSKVGEVVPLFITVDPERDGVQQVKEYIKEFHPDMIGLTGTPEKILEACRGFRVYYSAGPRDDEDDYIVDHTIIIYLIDPEGQFVDYYGQTKTAAQIEASVLHHMLKLAK